MKTLLVISGSNSTTSINKRLATYISTQVDDITADIVEWSELDLPLYSPQLEKEIGIPEAVQTFKQRIKAADGIILSLAEHNSMPSAAFKNLWDWCSRIDKKVWEDKPMFLAATSPGGRGAASVLEIINNLIPHYGGNVIASYSLPRFYDNFSENRITLAEKKEELDSKIIEFQKHLESQ